MGYAGGTSQDPTYRNLGDHTETVQLEFDPRSIRYEDLLEVFWHNHAPWEYRPVQYTSLLFYHNQEQEAAAKKTLILQEQATKKKLVTQIRPYDMFYLAEAYHQKYYLQQVPALRAEFLSVYPHSSDFIDSTVAAKVNGYVAGYGVPEVLLQEIQQFGLSGRAEKALVQAVVR